MLVCCLQLLKELFQPFLNTKQQGVALYFHIILNIQFFLQVSRYIFFHITPHLLAITESTQRFGLYKLKKRLLRAQLAFSSFTHVIGGSPFAEAARAWRLAGHFLSAQVRSNYEQRSPACGWVKCQRRREQWWDRTHNSQSLSWPGQTCLPH